jgi:hypothetical protein
MVGMWDGLNGYDMVLDRDDFGIPLGSCVIYRTPLWITLYGN